MQSQQLIATTCACSVCGNVMTTQANKNRLNGFILRCRCSNNVSVRINSFFSKSHFLQADIMVFINSYVAQELSLIDCANLTGMNYSSTAIDWGSYRREIFKEYFHRDVSNMVFKGEVEVDEAMFGRRRKHHRGEVKGMRVWVVGLVERSSDRLILYPVENRNEEAMRHIILKHVARGAVVHTDGWASYNWMNDHGYNHFNVIHKEKFLQRYQNTITGEVKVVHTNTIEGAWKYAKKLLKCMNGTTFSQFEGHLCQVMFKNHFPINTLEKFFEMVARVFPLDAPADYQYHRPVFDTTAAEVNGNADITVIDECITDEEKVRT